MAGRRRISQPRAPGWRLRQAVAVVALGGAAAPVAAQDFDAVATLDLCIEAIEKRSTAPFLGWSSYAELRFVAPDASVIAGLGTVRGPNGPLGYCLVTPANRDDGAAAEMRAKVRDRKAAEVYLPLDAARAMLDAQRFGQLKSADPSVNESAVACRPESKSAFLIHAYPGGLSVNLLPTMPTECEPKG